MLRIIYLWLALISPLSASQIPLSLAFDAAPVGQVLQALADYQQLNLVVAPGVEGTLSLRLKDVPWQQALQLVLKMGRLTMEKQGNVMLIYPESWQQEEERKTAARREAQEQTLPLHNRTLTLQHADAAAVNGSLQNERARLMTARGSITLDSRTNSLLLRDTESALDQAERWVRQLDVPLAQIELAAHIVTISEENLRELGVNWGLSGSEQVAEALRSSQLRVDLGVSRPAGMVGLTLAKLDGQLLDLELSALEREQQAEIIASPRLFTSHQQTASIKQGTEIPYEVASGNRGSTTMEFKEAMLAMEVTPEVQANGRILLKLHISQNVPGKNMRSGENEVLTIDKQEIDTQVMLKDGQTLALGGIFQQQSATGRTKVPFLGDIPLLGGLFRHDVREQKRRELVIFITPRLIRSD
ncbi:MULTISPECIES: DNA uptake porin HofQ [Erwinia]|uniref:DNA transporter HofQ n=1 Tax=Erwinia rhapontici TaxID=55212 RepID=A0ABM7MV92_ERWRD|nr:MULTISPECIES: DNA uptake porin HofQ [Erwinia]MBP2153744.1 protein transport protein HofQ [Erwinia rhapontici]MCS3608805.1 protein transport protein HofQ [Erwinia rhapontici]NKG31391.1 DNA uptake porin HofQ [Erwinia rhapontici]NNS09624.1 DNA uptake porin HofQ [Erwinia sp. JH02]TDS90870.1 protein transport protein HofQ [Erwinia rhapontici]